MASSLSRVLIPICIVSILLLSHSVKCDIDEEDSLLQSINSYRASLNLTTLVKNDNAECLADEVAEQFQRQPCTNSTGANTVPGTEPQFPNYPTLLAKCRLNISNTRDGAILPACVPNLETSLVVSNFTKSQYSDYLNDTKFTGIGIGHEDNWIVVILTTTTPEGSYLNARTTDNTGDDDDDDDNDRDDIHNDRKDRDDHDDVHDIDEEDILLQGINALRTEAKVSVLTKIEAVDCFADDFADRFQDQLCSNTTGSLAGPASTDISSYPDLMLRCGLNASGGIVLPACSPGTSPTGILSALKASKYATSLSDPKFSGVGVGSEDDWLVVVMTSNTPLGPRDVVPTGSNTPNTPNPFNTANAVDGVNGINAGFVSRISFLHYLLLLAAASALLI